MTSPDVIMIFAAGRGTRMAPLTDTRPKPLIEVGGKPLIDHALDLARAAGVSRVVVNTHYRADQMAAHLDAVKDPRIVISPETDQLMETGGGLKHAADLLGPAPVLTLNSDAVWTGENPLTALVRAWDPTRMDALLSLVARERAIGYDRTGDFTCDNAGRLQRRGSADTAPFVYTGAQILTLDRFADMPNAPFSTNVIWDQMLADGRLFGLPHSGGWADVGHPSSIALAERMLGA